MAVLMSIHGRFAKTFPSVIGRVSDDTDVEDPAKTVLVCRDGLLPKTNLDAFAAVLLEGDDFTVVRGRIGLFENLSHLAPGDLVLLDGLTGRLQTLYRQSSLHNALFVTERCNSNCLMCSQPPNNDAGNRLEACLRMIEFLKETPPAHLGITGGEPTLLGSGFLHLLEALKAKLPETSITTLSNGRSFVDHDFVGAVAKIGHPKLRFSIPLHADVADAHDYISQARGAFSATVAGFYNLAAHRVEAEVRVVLHALSAPRLPQLAEFIYRKLPFIQQTAFMGLENMGYAKKNWERLLMDPLDYASHLGVAVSYLHRRGMAASIYNLPLCVLPKSLWGFSRQSISDHKQTLIQKCDGCVVANHCAGFFTSGCEQYSRGIKAVSL